MSKRIDVNALARAASWRVLGTCVTGAVAYAVTRQWEIALLVAAVEFVAKSLLWPMHASIWNRLHPNPRSAEPFVLWFTGLSGSGKSTIADRTYDLLLHRGYRVARLDGDTVRAIFPETGFTRDERNSHIRRIGFLASMLEQHGVAVIASFVSPYNESRAFVRSLCRNFIEVFVSASLEECERRDVKGLYRKARAGELRHFTGIDDPYEAPSNPEVIVHTERQSVDESVALVMNYLKKYL